MNLPINKTLATEIILLGFSQNMKINIALFFFIFIIYLVTVAGNGFMVWAIISRPHLHTPMYFFLCQLSLIDIIYSSRTIPKLLVDLLSSSRRSSMMACRLQAYAGMFLGQMECLLLAVMAYDRYVAICRPLNYLLIMRWSICYRITASVLVTSFAGTVLPIMLLNLEICNPNQINHFCCEVQTGLKMSCNPINNLAVVLVYSVSFMVIFFPCIFILITYIVIISSILKIHSAGRSKAFSTCSSHIIVVSWLYGTTLVVFISPSSSFTSDQEKYATFVNLIIIPMLNPLIYSIRNKDVINIFVMKKKKKNLRSTSFLNRRRTKSCSPLVS